MLVLCFVASGLAGTTLFFTGLDDKKVAEFSEEYNRKIHSMWSSDTDVEIVSQDLVDHLRYRSGDKKIKIDSLTISYLKKYRYDSALAVIPTVEKFEIAKKRGKGVGIALGKGAGTLVVKYTYIDVITGLTVFNGTAKSDTSISLGTTGLRPIHQSVNLSAHERDQIITGLVDHNVLESYRIFHVYLDGVKRSKNPTDTTTAPEK